MMLNEVIEVIHKMRRKHIKFLKLLVKMLGRYRYAPISVLSKNLGVKAYFIRKIADFLKGYGLIEIRRREYEGYGITMYGLDLLALRAISSFVDIETIARRYDVGKEADIHLCYSSNGEPYIIKVYRLGRTSFKKVRSARPGYYETSGGWIRLNIRAAGKEYSILQKLWSVGVSVPKPLMKAYHLILMEYVPGKELHKVKLTEPLVVYEKIVIELLRAYKAGVVHADLSEFNILVDAQSNNVWLIDWPQWLESEHEEAEKYLRKDIEQVLVFFNKKYRINTGDLWRIFDKKVHELIDESMGGT